MKFAHSQKGMSMLGWVVVLTIVAFLASTTLKMLPHYMDFWSLENAIKSVETDRALGITTVSDFYSHVDKSMQINGVRELSSKDILEIKLEGGDFLVHLKYEKREPLIQNLDLVANFDKEFRIRAQ